MRTAAFLFPLLCLAGCDARVEQFDPNQVYSLTLATSRGVETQNVTTDVDVVVQSLFGTPEKPIWPRDILESSEADTLVSDDDLKRSAGPVLSDRDGTNFGLFNKHCVNCHGLNGSGAGPASMLQNPYPRDFRAGIFKWKSTVRGAKPTQSDLTNLMHRGIRGTAMPSFSILSEEDIDALTGYVIYLSVRGESERRLMAAAVDDLGYDDEDMTTAERLTVDSSVAQTTVRGVVDSWLDAKTKIVAAENETVNDAASIQRGKDIFHGQVANCVGCHGTGGNGNTVLFDFDDWTKEYSSRIGVTPTDREAMKPFRKAGAHRPRKMTPRKLNEGVFRGGGEAETLFRRINQGIAGTPMPSVSITAEPSKTGLSRDQAWDLVHYVQSLRLQTPKSEE